MADQLRRIARLHARLSRPLTIVIGNLALDLLAGRSEYYDARAVHYARMAVRPHQGDDIRL